MRITVQFKQEVLSYVRHAERQESRIPLLCNCSFLETSIDRRQLLLPVMTGSCIPFSLTSYVFPAVSTLLSACTSLSRSLPAAAVRFTIKSQEHCTYGHMAYSHPASDCRCGHAGARLQLQNMPVPYAADLFAITWHL